MEESLFIVFGSRPKRVERARKEGDRTYLQNAGRRGARKSADRRSERADERRQRREERKRQQEEEAAKMWEERNGDPKD